MSQRYTPLVDGVLARGGRPACAALIHWGDRGIEAELRLPAVDVGGATDPAPPTTSTRLDASWPPPAALRYGPPTIVQPAPAPAAEWPAPEPRAVGARRIWPLWIGSGLAALLIVAGIAGGGEPATSTPDATGLPTTSVPAATPTTTAPAAVPELSGPPTGSAPAPPRRTETPPSGAARTSGPAKPAPAEPAPAAMETAGGGCHSSYTGACVPIASDVDGAGGSGDGPKYVSGPVRVVGPDAYDLDRDGNGVACET